MKNKLLTTMKTIMEHPPRPPIKTPEPRPTPPPPPPIRREVPPPIPKQAPPPPVPRPGNK
jgi:hypothetical protein